MGAKATRARHEGERKLPEEGTTNSVAEESEHHDCSTEVMMTETISLHRNCSLDLPPNQAKFEKQLVAEKQRSRMQENEISHMRALVEQLETMVDRQASMTKSEHDRIARLEQAMSEQQTGTEEKVAKLLLAVASEKRRADMVEQDNLDLERKHKAVVEELSQQLEAAHAASSSTAMDQPETWDDPKRQLLAELELRGEAERCVVGLELQVKTLQQEVEKLTSEAVERQHADTQSLANRDTVGENAETTAVAEVESLCHNEIAKRIDLQNKLLKKELQVWGLQRQVITLQDNLVVTSRSPRCDQHCLAAQEAKKQCLELAEKEVQLRKVQTQLADELSKRVQLQGQVLERDKQLRDMHLIAEDTDHCRQEAEQEQLLQATRELVALQGHLTQELAQRQSVQYKVIERERVIFDLERQLTMERSIGPMGLPVGGVADGSISDFEGGTGTCASPSEPEGEDATFRVGLASRVRVQQVASPRLVASAESTPRGTLRTPPSYDPTAFMSLNGRVSWPITTNSSTIQESAVLSPGVQTRQRNITFPWNFYHQPSREFKR